MNFWLLSAIGIVGIAGCSMESSADRSTKSGLLGSWYYEFKDPSERSIKGVASLQIDGTFTERVRVAGDASEEVTKGVWHVTDGLLKLDATERDGKKMGTLEDRYRTCSVSNLTSTSFSCSFGGNGQMLRYQKVQHGHPLS